MKKTYRFNFDLNIVNNLRREVNFYNNYIEDIEKKYSEKIKKNHYIWDRICAGIDRLQDTIEYLNLMRLAEEKKTRSAFDFYEFINCMNTVIDIVELLNEFFIIDVNSLEYLKNSNNIFKIDDSSDYQYFKYIRSVCVIHPLDTSRHKSLLRGDVSHCSPYVIWTDEVMRSLYNDNRDLTATIYNSNYKSESIQIPLKIVEFEKYLTLWINHINVIIKNIKIFCENKISTLKEEKICGFVDFNNEVDYLLYLKNKYIQRFGVENNYVFDKFINLFKTNLTDETNNNKFNLFKSAIMYSLSFLANSIKNVSTKGYSNTGIKEEYSFSYSSLFNELCFVQKHTTEFKDYWYNLEKVHYLDPKYGYSKKYKDHARYLLEQIKPIINKYVLFTNTESDEETIILVDLALYFSALNSNGDFSKCIPNTAEFRLK